MSYIITIQYPYQYLTITLSDNTTMLATQTISKFKAISDLIPTFNTMLIEHNLKLTDIACIGINTGPGPFNTLRSIIATANAISFAQQIPLVGCNGLELLLQESDSTNAIAILDAFGSDVYFGIKSSGKFGYNSIEKVIEELNLSDKKDALLFIGNGAVKHKEFIEKNFAGTAIFSEEILFASTQSLIDKTYKKFIKQEISTEIFPLYFASPVVKS